MLMEASLVCGVERSFTDRAWRWRRHAADGTDDGFRPDDLTDLLLLARGVAREDLARHRQPTIRNFMPDPSIFRDMDKAAARIADAVEAGEKVAIFGDYDVDGATSAALMIRLLRQLGLSPAPYIPDRLMEGYGPSGTALVQLAKAGASLIVTVDCGAQAFDALAEAQLAGVDVIVVDHHQCTTELPAALAVVNPNRVDECEEGAGHGHLAAVGVAFLLGAALLRVLRARGFFDTHDEPRLIDLLDLVALGTVADVAQLKGLNRAFVTQGLKIMAKRGNIGLAALAEAARLTRAPVCSDLGFALGPRINAAGRVGTSDLGVRLLTTQDPLEAAAIAAELDHHNEERRAIEAFVLEAAEVSAARQGNRAVVVTVGAGWHPGVIGIVAGRLKEKMERPAFVIGVDAQGVGKGSARSIPGVDLGAAVLAAKQSGLLVSGGGHAMAAGLTVSEDKIAALTDFLEERLSADVARSRGERMLRIDASLSCGGVCPDMVEALDAAGPYGAGWAAPRVVAGPARLLKADVVGSGGHLRLLLAGEDGKSVKAVAFRSADAPLGVALRGAIGRKLWVAGKMKRDEWNGRVGAELHLDDAAFAD